MNLVNLIIKIEEITFLKNIYIMETVDILFFIAFVFVLISGVYSFIIRKEIEKNKKVLKVSILEVITTIVFLIGTFCYFKKPKAIDVYRGKTELVITYENDVPTDSTVVFKK